MLIALFCAGNVLPVVLNHPGVRNDLLGRAVAPHGLTASCSGCTGGWLTEFRFHDVVLSSDSGSVRVTMEALHSGQSVISRLLGRSGGVTLVRPNVHAELPVRKEGAAESDPVVAAVPERDLEFEIQDGSLIVTRSAEPVPVVDLNGLNIRGVIRKDAQGCWLETDSIRIFDRAPLSDVPVRRHLVLAAPLLARSVRLTGFVSVEVDPVRMRLDHPVSEDSVLFSGTVQLHEIHAHFGDQWLRQIARQVHPGNLSRPSLQLVGSCTVAFQVLPDGIRHSGCSLLLPELAGGLMVESSGMLCLDESIDLTLRIRPQDSGDRAGETADGLTAFSARVTGTVSHPEIVLSGETLPAVAGAVLSAGEQDRAVAGAVRGIIRAASSSRDVRRRELPGRILKLIRTVESGELRRPRQP